ncbi:MAG: GNAT family N-acetyltransferase [Caldilineaceae bacterium]|nr:GNAT family N-acetyltransferase [Caldilineaceae bacterium]
MATIDQGANGQQMDSPQAEDLPLDCIIYGPDASVNGFDALASEWNSLLARSRFDTFFLTHEWQSTWWEELGEGELWILAFRNRADQKLVGIAPLYRLQHTSGDWAGLVSLHIVGCIEVSDFLDLIIAKGWEAQVYDALRRWLESDAAPQWDLCDFCNLPQDSLTYRDLPTSWEAACYRVEVFQEDVAPHIPLPLRYADYLTNQVDKKQRHEIRRKQRRAEREIQVDFYLVQPGIDDFDLDAELDDFIRLQRLSSPDKEEFMTPEMQRFFKVMARRMLDAGFLRLAFLSLNGKKAATLFAFEYRRQFLLYNSGYDTSDMAHYSPGWVLLAYLIQYAIAAGCQIFDFLQGDEEYKYHFGSVNYKVMRAIVHNRRAG